jgi:MFS family permease
MAPETNIESSAGAIRSITRRYYLVWWAYSFGGAFMFGIYPLFLRSRGLNQFQVNTVLAIYFLVTFLTDVPTGAFADAIGRRTSFVLGCLLRTAAFTVYFFSHHYWLFIVAESIDAVGTTFANGAIDAWAVDSLDGAGFSGTKDRLFSRSSQMFRFGSMGGAIIGAYAAAIEISLPWILGAVGYLFAAAIGALVMTREWHRAAQFNWREVFGQMRERMSVGVRSGLSSRPVFVLAVANAFQIAAWAPFWMEWPRYFNDSFGIGIQVVGWLFCLFSIAGMIGAELVARFEPYPSSRAPFLAAVTAIASILMLAAGLSGERTALVLVLFFAANLCNGAIGPIYQSWFNEQIDGTHRATLLSFQGTFATFGGSVGLPIGGRIADLFGLGVGWQASGLISALSVPCYWMLRPAPAKAELAVEPAD